MRTIAYGIPVLVLGVLAALPFRKIPESDATEQRAETVSQVDWSIEPIQEVPVTDLPAWELPQPVERLDPMRAAADSLPPMPDSYHAVAVPLDVPPKIASRFSAVARDPSESGSNAPAAPLVGHPAMLASTGRRADRGGLPPHTAWRRAIPIGAPEANTAEPGRLAVAAPQSPADPADDPSTDQLTSVDAFETLPAPRPLQPQSASPAPWPTLAELSSAKQMGKKVAKVSHGSEQEDQSSDPIPARRNTDAALSKNATDRPKASRPPLSINSSSDRSQDDRERFYIREPTS